MTIFIAIKLLVTTAKIVKTIHIQSILKKYSGAIFRLSEEFKESQY